jgi:branched-chain amino acid transport system permease protein
MGDSLLIISFVVVVIGGLGSVSGAFWSALLIGMIDTLGKAYGSALVGAAAGGLVASMSVYALMVIVLLLKPTGLFGGRT